MRILAFLLFGICVLIVNFVNQNFVDAIAFGLGFFAFIAIFLEVGGSDRESPLGVMTKLFTFIVIAFFALIMWMVWTDAEDISLVSQFSKYVLGTPGGDYRLSIQIANDPEYQAFLDNSFRNIWPALVSTIVFAYPSVWLTLREHSWRRFPIVAFVCIAALMVGLEPIAETEKKAIGKAPMNIAECKAFEYSSGSSASYVEKSSLTYDVASDRVGLEQRSVYQPGTASRTSTYDSSDFGSCTHRLTQNDEWCSVINLCVSAVKYNIEGGTGPFIELSIEETKKFISLQKE